MAIIPAETIRMAEQEAADRAAARHDESEKFERLRLAAKAVCDHWAEFGPEYGFDETMEGLYRALRNEK